MNYFNAFPNIQLYLTRRQICFVKQSTIYNIYNIYNIQIQYPQVGDLLGRVTGPPMSDRVAPRWPWYCAGLAGAGAAMLLLAAARDTATVIRADK